MYLYIFNVYLFLKRYKINNINFILYYMHCKYFVIIVDTVL